MKPGLKGIVAGALGLLVSASAGAAVDSKIYPGSMCKPANSTVTSITTGASDSGYLQNYNLTVGVTCPVVRDQVTGKTPASAWVSIYDPSTTNNVACYLYSSNSTAGTISFGSAFTSNAFKGTEVLQIMNIPTGTGWWDTLNVSCVVAPGGKIYAYNVDETLQTD